MDLNNPDSKIYTLDFTKATGGRVSIMKAIPQFIINNEYANAFINAFDIMSDDDKNKVKSVIKSLFDGGVDGAKNRKLIITENSDNSVGIQLLTNDQESRNEKVTKNPTSTFEGYLKTLGDGIMPI